MEEIDVIEFLVNILGVPASHFEGANILFYIIIPFVVSSYASYTFLKSLRIFERQDAVNMVIGTLFNFVLMRFLYPLLFFISILYLIVIKKWPKSAIFRIGFIVLFFVLYFIVYPFLTNIINEMIAAYP